MPEPLSEEFRADVVALARKREALELTHLLAHPIVSQGSQEGVPDGSPLEIPGGVPA